MAKRVKIKGIRKKLDIYLESNPDVSIEKFAVEIGVNSRTIVRLRKEEETNNLALIVALHKKLKVPYSVLLGEENINDFNFENSDDIIEHLKELTNRVRKIEDMTQFK